MKFRIEQTPYPNWDELLPRRHQLAYVKYDKSKPTWTQVGTDVYYIAPFGYVIRIVHMLFINFKIFNCWIPWKFRKIKRDIKILRELWKNA